MGIGQAIQGALRTLLVQRLRTALTLFGLVWGTASVIFLVAWGGGVRVMVEAGYSKVGKNLTQAWTGRIGEDFTPAVDRRELGFSQSDVDHIRGRVRHADLVAGESYANWNATYGQKTLIAGVRGVEPDIVEIRDVEISAGRAISRSDLDHRRRVAVVGSSVRRRLLGPSGHIGSRIRMDGRSYEVVGFLAEVGTQFWQDGGFGIDDQIWIPHTTLQAVKPALGTGESRADTILFRLRDRRDYDALVIEIREILAPRLGVSATDSEAILIGSPIDGLRRLPLDQLGGFMFILGATTLLIGGIGVLNMMLDSVQERRQEIGIRLAVGARRRDIMLQFFLETLVVTGLGGGLGVLLGVAGCAVLGLFSMPELIPVPILRRDIVIAAVATMTLVGLAAGLVPAWRAARIDPSVTLRVE